MNPEPFPSITLSSENEHRIERNRETERNRAHGRELHRKGTAHMARFYDGEHDYAGELEMFLKYL